jgi:hypothetical protein
MKKIQDIKVRFFKYVIKSNDDNCWIWTGAKTPFGYGRFGTIGNKRVYAHRFSYEIHEEKIPNGYLICHSCDNPSCVNPKHLWLGTPKDNMDDMRKKGRNSGDTGQYLKSFKGSNHPCSKLNEEKVKEIRIKLKNGIKGYILADEYNVSRQLIYTIKDGLSWKHVIV